MTEGKNVIKIFIEFRVYPYQNKLDRSTIHHILGVPGYDSTRSASLSHVGLIYSLSFA
jgi:hypothetical protein